MQRVARDLPTANEQKSEIRDGQNDEAFYPLFYFF